MMEQHSNQPPESSITTGPRQKSETPICTKYISPAKLESLYHLPVSQAAKKLGISVRTFQRLCKSHQVRRWPYRRIRSINRKVENLLCKAVETEDEDEFQNYRQLIELHEMKKLFIMMAASWDSREAQDKASRIAAESLEEKEVFDDMIETAILFSTQHQQRARVYDEPFSTSIVFQHEVRQKMANQILQILNNDDSLAENQSNVRSM
mmetsp:Transcript_27697/g.45331  ORF Transcript_27697/g.45331 Transcript_27697/m.45331 type:complete len:208 (+) Transcript_27697:41-664(+)